MSKESKTLRNLYSELPHGDIARQAEDNFRRKVVSRRRFSQRLINFLPLGTLLAWIVAYILSAPHTAALFMRITPAPVIEMLPFIGAFPLASLGPIVIEAFIFIIAAINQYGKRNYGVAMWGMFALSVAVNIVGGLVALWDFASTTEQFYSNPFEIGWFILAPLAGILVSYLSVISGRILLQFATGDIALEIDPTQNWHGRAKYFALYETFYNAALKHGATPSRSNKYALTMARQYTKGEVKVDEDGAVYAVSRTQPVTPDTAQLQPQSRLSGQSGTARTVSVEMGFAAIAGQKQGQSRSENDQDSADIVDSPDIGQKPSKAAIAEWLETGDSAWQDWIAGLETKRKRSKRISRILYGHEGAYKTVERAFDEKGIAL